MNADDVRRGWARRSREYSPGYYAYYGPDEASELIRRTLDGLVERDAAIVELGCSSGRHLKHLHDHGYEDLHGVDINDDAFDVMASVYPDLAAAGTFYHGAIEQAVGEFDDGQFGAVFSVETLQHVHAADEWVFSELARITDDVLITVECEGPGDRHDDREAEPSVNYVNGDFPLYYRRWKQIFTDLGLVQVDERPVDGDTFRMFRHAQGSTSG